MIKGTAAKRNIIFVVLLIFSMVFILSSCNKQPEEINPSEISLYLVDTSFNEDEYVMTVTVGQTGPEENKIQGESLASMYSVKKNSGSFYTQSESVISLNSSSIFSAVNNMLTQDEKIYNGTLYSCLKVEFQYATIYKSIISKGITTKQGRYYIHTFTIDETAENQQISLSLRQQNSAAWYGTLAGCSVAVMLIAGAACVIIRRKNGKQK